jgi:periplasmic protein CpxP/Spy
MTLGSGCWLRSGNSFVLKIDETNTKPTPVRRVTPPNSPERNTAMKDYLKISLFSLGAGLCAFATARADDQPPATPPPATPPPASADTNGPAWHGRKHNRDEYMAKELGLSADQQAKMQTLRDQEHAAAKAIFNDTTLSQDQKHQKLQDLRKNFQSQRQAILTPDQLKKAAELREQRKGHRAHSEANENTPPPSPAPDPGGV